MYKYIFAFLALAFSFSLSAQSNMKRLNPAIVKVKVVGVLEGNPKLAVIQLLEVDKKNKYKLEVEQEILVTFYFGTKPHQNEPVLPGVKQGEIITAELVLKEQDENGNSEALVFKYWPEESTKENPSSSTGDSPQK